MLGSVDAANNPRNNMPSYHDIISTERWEMRFSGFVLGICEANTFSAYRNFYANSSNMGHTTFRDTFVWFFLNYCGALSNPRSVSLNPAPPRVFRSSRIYVLISNKTHTDFKSASVWCYSMWSPKNTNGLRSWWSSLQHRLPSIYRKQNPLFPAKLSRSNA